MRCLLVLAVGCGATTMSPGWRPQVLAAGPQGQELVLPIGPNGSGTQLVIAALVQARAAGATALSDIALQLGRCVRDISIAPAAPLVDPVAFETSEPEVTCGRTVDLQFVASPTQGFDRKEGIRDTEMVEREDCTTAPRTRIVTRERLDVEHRFAPPRWATIARWSGLALHAGPLHCDAPDERSELRLRLHFGPAMPSPPGAAPVVGDPAAIVAAVARARSAADPSADAEHALALWRAGDFDAGLSHEVAAAIAEAAFLAVQADATRFLARGVPSVADVAWMASLDAELDRLANRYLWIGQAVRLPEAQPWLRGGALVLAALHAHVADLFAQLGREEAARRQRVAADRLRSQVAR